MLLLLQSCNSHHRKQRSHDVQVSSQGAAFRARLAHTMMSCAGAPEWGLTEELEAAHDGWVETQM